jgi:hypothetical protein
MVTKVMDTWNLRIPGDYVVLVPLISSDYGKQGFGVLVEILEKQPNYSW